MAMNVQYRPDIDGLRGVAVIAVILFHLFPSVFNYGYLGVDVFFVISGFVVTQALGKNLVQGFACGLLDFYGRRIKRILPALYFNIIVAFTLCALFIPPSDLRSIFKTAATAVIGVSNIGLLYARFDYFSADLSLNAFVHTWSLGVEEQFYLAFPLLFIFGLYLEGKGRKFIARHLLMVCAALSFIYWAYLSSNAYVSAFYNPLGRFWELLAGSILYRKRDAVFSLIKGNANTLFQYLAACLLVVTLFASPSIVSWNVFSKILAVLGATIIIATGLVSTSHMNGLLRHRILVWTGKLSYSLFLWHYTIFVLTRWNADLSSPSYVITALLLTFCISYLSYRFIELPCRYASFPSVSIIFGGLAATAFSFIFVCGLYFLPTSRIYMGNAGYYAGLWPSDNAPLTQSLKTSQRVCHLQYLDRWSADLFDECSAKPRNGDFIYLIGNSHAQHLVPMLEAVSRKLGYGYTALTISNCRLISAFQMMLSINFRFDLCKDYLDNSFNYILEHAKSGDIVLVANRSLFEKSSPETMDTPTNVYLDGRQLSVKEAYEKSLADFSSFSQAMSSRGVPLVFVGPTPSFSVPVTQCAPEWFRIKKDYPLTLESQVIENKNYLSAISDIMAKGKNCYLWNPMTALCDDTYCYPYRDNKLLFRDQHHLSIYGSESLAPNFVEFLNSIKDIALAKHD